MLVLAILLAVVSATAGTYTCYQEIATNTSSTTNYTLLSEGFAAAMINNYQLIVRDGAKILANETIPTITKSITVVGEHPEGEVLAYVLSENTDEPYTFVVDAPLGDVVLFENLNFVFGHVLFRVVNDAQLTLSSIKCIGGITCVSVETNTAGVIPPGAVIETLTVEGSAIGLLHISGYISCRHCIFYDCGTASVLTRNPATNPFEFITFYGNTNINVMEPIAYQQSETSVITPPILTSAYVDRTIFFNCQTYGAAPSFGSGGSGTTECAPCAACEKSSAVSIIFSIGFFGCIYLCIVRGGKNKKAAPKK